jgi:hypothetical protein
MDKKDDDNDSIDMDIIDTSEPVRDVERKDNSEVKY